MYIYKYPPTNKVRCGDSVGVGVGGSWGWGWGWRVRCPQLIPERPSLYLGSSTSKPQHTIRNAIIQQCFPRQPSAGNTCLLVISVRSLFSLTSSRTLAKCADTFEYRSSTCRHSHATSSVSSIGSSTARKVLRTSPFAPLATRIDAHDIVLQERSFGIISALRSR